MERGNKSLILGQIFEHRDSKLFELFIALLDLLIEENRNKMDSATAVEIPNLQGRIIQMKEIRDLFLKKPIKKV